MNRIRATTNFLRILALSQLVAFTVVVLPDSWLAALLAWLGLGRMPDAVIFHYPLRGAAWCQGAFGVLFWIMASDVVRYRPLVIATSLIYLVAAPTFYFLDVLVGLPRWWPVWDCGCCLLAGGFLLMFCLWPPFNRSHLPAPLNKPEQL